ncbi:MAG: ABC transporter substrate-binding protein [Lachnospiraceae bacterium]|nr:ABC transporter substrate-binding protein [Lachnospiraceae bacterium]
MKKNIVIKKLATVLLTGLLAVSAVGCGASGDKATGSGASTGEKVLNVGVINIADTPFDPAQTSLSSIEQIEPLNDTLLHVDKDGNYTPGIAKSWELSDDYKTFTINLRDDVKFHDGTKLTSDDVKFTLEYYISEESNQSDKGILQANIDSVEAKDETTVVVNFKEPFTDFEYLISEGGTGAGIIIPKAYFEKVGSEGFNKAPIGAGPFKFESFAAGEEIVYTAFEDYYQGKAKIDRLVIRQLAEESTKISSIQAGDVDFAPININSVETVEATPGVNVEKVDYSNTLGVFATAANGDDGKPLQNDKVREALYISVNRAELVDTVFGGDAIESPVWGVFPFTVGYEGGRENIPYDVEKAKDLLKEAGYPENFDDPVIKLYITETTTYNKEVAQSLVSYWDAIGAQVEIVTTDPVTLRGGYTKKPLDPEFTGVLFFFNPPKKYSANDAIAPFFPTNSSMELIKDNDEFDNDVKQLVRVGAQERTQLVNKLLDTIEETHVAIPIVYPSQNYAVSENVVSWDQNYSAHWGNWFYTFEVK